MMYHLDKMYQQFPLLFLILILILRRIVHHTRDRHGGVQLAIGMAGTVEKEQGGAARNLSSARKAEIKLFARSPRSSTTSKEPKGLSLRFSSSVVDIKSQHDTSWPAHRSAQMLSSQCTLYSEYILGVLGSFTFFVLRVLTE